MIKEPRNNNTISITELLNYSSECGFDSRELRYPTLGMSRSFQSFSIFYIRSNVLIHFDLKLMEDIDKLKTTSLIMTEPAYVCSVWQDQKAGYFIELIYDNELGRYYFKTWLVTIIRTITGLQ